MNLVLFWLLGVPASVALLFGASSLTSGPANAKGPEMRIIDSQHLHGATSSAACLEIVLNRQGRSERRVPCRLTTG